jgi:hemerythrin-like domain-containing protein
MTCIELMVDEHKKVIRMLAVIRRLCGRVLNNEPVDYRDFFVIIEFIRNYTDKHHHGKEEVMLFARMMEELGPTAEKIIRHGMLVEHELGRLYVKELEDAVRKVLKGDMDARLDVIANAISYTHLLARHIDKEDNVIYKYGQNNLKKETMDRLERECDAFEQTAAESKTQDKYLNILKELEAKYIT